jgi:hypothetical protein
MDLHSFGCIWFDCRLLDIIQGQRLFHINSSFGSTWIDCPLLVNSSFGSIWLDHLPFPHQEQFWFHLL